MLALAFLVGGANISEVIWLVYRQSRCQISQLDLRVPLRRHDEIK